MQVSLKHTENFTFIQNLFQYYIYDMSEFTGFEPNDAGSFQVDDSLTGLSDYWSKPDHLPYLIMCNEEVAGFALIRKYPDSDNEFDMGQFFILRKFKRQGIGEQAFAQVLQKHPGKWLVRVLQNNPAAKSFWSKVIQRQVADEVTITQSQYKNHQMDFMRFSNAV